MDDITHCKLKKNTQRRLLEFFVLEVAARSAADFLKIQPNMAVLFYKKIRQVIVYHLALEEQEMFDGKVELIDTLFWRSSQRKKRMRGDRKGSSFWHSQEKRKGLYGGY